jgi:hypothetical protein
MTITELQDQRAALVAALGGGELRVVIQSAGARREVEYRSIADIERAIAAIDREIAANSGTRINTFLPTFSKGL